MRFEINGAITFLRGQPGAADASGAGALHETNAYLLLYERAADESADHHRTLDPSTAVVPPSYTSWRENSNEDHRNPPATTDEDSTALDSNTTSARGGSKTAASLVLLPSVAPTIASAAAENGARAGAGVSRDAVSAAGETFGTIAVPAASASEGAGDTTFFPDGGAGGGGGGDGGGERVNREETATAAAAGASQVVGAGASGGKQGQPRGRIRSRRGDSIDWSWGSEFAVK